MIDLSGKLGPILKVPCTNNLDRPLNETSADKIRDYRADHNNRPSNSFSFMPAVVSTSGHLHCELVRILILQTHRETRFFSSWGVQLPQSNQFQSRRTVFYSQLKSKVGLILAQAEALRVNLDIDDTHIDSKNRILTPHTLRLLSS